MSHENHEWQLGKSPPVIREHSLAKHRVLKAYLERYVAVLTGNLRQEQLRLTLIDGFAGGGEYVDRSGNIQPGSPLIMLNAMAQAQEAAQSLRNKPFFLDAHYLFIDSNRRSLEYLRNVLSQSKYANQVGDNVHLLHGDFVSHVPEILDYVKRRGRADRALFVLDQFGYKDVPLSTIRTILETLDKAEVILTFATDFLIDYLSENQTTQQILEAVGISLPPTTIRTAKEAREWRRAIQFSLHKEIPQKTGARYYTPFFRSIRVSCGFGRILGPGELPCMIPNFISGFLG